MCEERRVWAIFLNCGNFIFRDKMILKNVPLDHSLVKATPCWGAGGSRCTFSDDNLICWEIRWKTQTPEGNLLFICIVQHCDTDRSFIFKSGYAKGLLVLYSSFGFYSVRTILEIHTEKQKEFSRLKCLDSMIVQT